MARQTPIRAAASSAYGWRQVVAVLLLGAGATRGASFVDPRKNPCLPPLDSDFFTQLQRVSSSKHQTLIGSVIKDVVELFGVNFKLTLEAVFTTLEHTLRMLETTGETRDFKRSSLEQKRDRLLQAIAAVMEESLADGRDPRSCDHHGRLVEMLQPSDCLVTFNYDCLLDQALKDKGAGKWNPRYGYCLPLGSRGTRLVGDKFWSPDKPAPRDGTIRFFKLHGSLHFHVGPKRVKLKERPYTKQKGGVRFTIIPPQWNKTYDELPFGRLWKRAGAEVHRATTLVVIGYSFPPSDLHSTALFRISVRQNALKSVVIANPDAEARRRARDVLQRGFSSETRILVFDDFAEFVAADRSLWDPDLKLKE